ncbi:hypothetical protein PQX77_004311 [Marasmius sp. AFHP31]|nr:hypothetical protein PQX77_004311 [Marasmius sp. AFHP31]
MRSTERNLLTKKPRLPRVEDHKGVESTITTRRGKYSLGNRAHSRATREHSDDSKVNVVNETGEVGNESDDQLGGLEESEEDEGDDLTVQSNQRTIITFALWQQFEKLYKARGTQKELHEWKERHKNERCIRCIRLDFLCTKTVNDGKIVCKECIGTVDKHCSRMDNFRKERMSKKMEISDALWEEMNSEYLKRNDREPLTREEGFLDPAGSVTEKEDLPESNAQEEGKITARSHQFSPEVTQKEVRSSASVFKGQQKRKWSAHCEEDETTSSPAMKKGKVGSSPKTYRHRRPDESDDRTEEKIWRRHGKWKEQEAHKIALTPQVVELPVATSVAASLIPSTPAPPSSVGATPKAAGTGPDIAPSGTESPAYMPALSFHVRSDDKGTNVSANPVDISVARGPASSEGILLVASPTLSATAQHLQQSHVQHPFTQPTVEFSTNALDSSLSLSFVKRQLEDVSSDLRYARIDVASAVVKLDDVAARLGRYPSRGH